MQSLSPSQQRAFDLLTKALSTYHVVALQTNQGTGRTTLLREVHRAHGGAFLAAKDYLDALQARHPLALEEAFESLLLGALTAHDCVIVDDLHLLCNVVSGCPRGTAR